MRDKAAAGTPLADVLLHVIEPAQVEIGRLWQVNRIDVGQEHFATSVSQDLMAELHRPAGAQRRRRHPGRRLRRGRTARYRPARGQRAL
ncbi:MAG: B12-binding domain-containing protein [Rhodovibrio sp.]|nr:B12-binding domain-containing protein [Rhodovibrio sp.]